MAHNSLERVLAGGVVGQCMGDTMTYAYYMQLRGCTWWGTLAVLLDCRMTRGLVERRVGALTPRTAGMHERVHPSYKLRYLIARWHVQPCIIR